VETGDARPRFTPREREVLDELVRGRTNYEIAQRLGISLDGVKWHIREILSKLGVASREEAAEYWSGQRGWRRAARRTVGVLFGLRTGLAVVGMLGVGAFVAGAWFLLRPADEAATPEEVLATARASLGPTSAPRGALPTPPPATPWADGETIPFTCNVSYAARRPTIAEIKASSPLWVRFQGADGRLFPGLFGMSLSSVYYNSDPFANSAQIEPSSFFSSIPRPDASTRCSAVPGEHIISLRDYRPVSLTKAGTGAVLVVEADPGTRHEIAFEARTPRDTTGKGGVSPPPLTKLSVFNLAGPEITEMPFHNAGPVWEADGAGRLIYAEVEPGSPSPFHIALGGVPQQLRVLAEGTGNDGALDIAVLDASGRTLSTVQVASGAHAWDQLALIDVPAEARILQVSRSRGDVPGIFIVPVETELPD
jgi:DNA-binding CsgD family transcriptional regulator